MAKKIKHPDERKIKKYLREDPTFDPAAYRRAFYRVGKQTKEKDNGNDKKGLRANS